MSTETARAVHSRYMFWLCACYILFIFRVLAQLIQKLYDLPFLPPFEAWYSGVLAYPWLLVFQILIIIAMGWLILRFAKGFIVPKRKFGIFLIVFGCVYFLVMLFRLIAGFTFAIGYPWLGAPIPAFFHIVLASFALLVGHFHYRYSKNGDI